jgi:hypothetical protein
MASAVGPSRREEGKAAQEEDFIFFFKNMNSIDFC